MKKHIVAIAMVCAIGGSASAQTFDDPESTESPTEESSEPASTPAASGSAEVSAEGSGGAAMKMGIEVDLNAVGELGLLHFLYNLGGHNYLDVGLGFDLTVEMPDEGDSETVLALTTLVGYRMYSGLTGRIRPFIEPYVLFAWADNDAVGNPLVFGAGGRFGVDFELFEQFTLGAALGAQIDYTLADEADELEFGLYTTAIAATFWW